MSDKTQHCPSCESLVNELAATKQNLEAAQLHIKELRAALHHIADPDSNHPRFNWTGGTQAAYEDIASEALAKQPDTRALDKALLEAAIVLLTDVRLNNDAGQRVSVYKAKLAELNKP